MTNEQRISLVAHGLDELPIRDQHNSVSVEQNDKRITLNVQQGNQERFIEMSLQQAEMVLIELFSVVVRQEKQKEEDE